MLSLREPTADVLAARRRELADSPLSAPAELLAGTDAGRPRRVWFRDQSGGSLGRGDDVWRAAVAAVERWASFDQEWLRLSPPPRLAVGALAAMIVRVGPVWFTNWCRITELIDEGNRFGFVYVTLEEHAEVGAERFLVTRTGGGEVRWEVTAVSRPGAWFSWFGQPAVRFLQARFRRGSLAAMRAAVSAAVAPTSGCGGR